MKFNVLLVLALGYTASNAVATNTHNNPVIINAETSNGSDIIKPTPVPCAPVSAVVDKPNALSVALAAQPPTRYINDINLSRNRSGVAQPSQPLPRTTRSRGYIAESIITDMSADSTGGRLNSGSTTAAINTSATGSAATGTNTVVSTGAGAGAGAATGIMATGDTTRNTTRQVDEHGNTVTTHTTTTRTPVTRETSNGRVVNRVEEIIRTTRVIRPSESGFHLHAVETEPTPVSLPVQPIVKAVKEVKSTPLPVKNIQQGGNLSYLPVKEIIIPSEKEPTQLPPKRVVQVGRIQQQY